MGRAEAMQGPLVAASRQGAPVNPTYSFILLVPSVLASTINSLMLFDIKI